MYLLKPYLLIYERHFLPANAPSWIPASWRCRGAVWNTPLSVEWSIWMWWSLLRSHEDSEQQTRLWVPQISRRKQSLSAPILLSWSSGATRTDMVKRPVSYYINSHSYSTQHWLSQDSNTKKLKSFLEILISYVRTYYLSLLANSLTILSLSTAQY